MNWLKLDSEDKLQDILQESKNTNILVFKYSPGCIVNYVVKFLFEREWNEMEMKMKTYLLNIAENTGLSGKVEKITGITHESPQVFIFRDSTPVFNASHGRILFSEVRKFNN
ncbi:MAG: hypothetical protein UZ05_CHB002003028 [Chlorobi bacterium OLB5]|nr:MAG: hypothetical protein UZ05_CHB002003028 [Chlorobi bacterium OLB5]